MTYPFLAIFAMFLLFGCSPVGEQPELLASFGPSLACADLHAPEADAATAVFPDEVFVIPEPLRLTPDVELLPLLQVSAARYRERFGLEVEFVGDGIPVTMEPEIIWRGQAYDGLATYQRHCTAGACSDPKFGVAIMLTEDVVLGTKQWGAQQTSDHELGHVWSGWGRVQNRSHLPDGNMMAAGCRNHVCPPWTSMDADFICGVAPCGKINLPSQPLPDGNSAAVKHSG